MDKVDETITEIHAGEADSSEDSSDEVDTVVDERPIREPEDTPSVDGDDTDSDEEPDVEEEVRLTGRRKRLAK